MNIEVYRLILSYIDDLRDLRNLAITCWTYHQYLPMLLPPIKGQQILKEAIRLNHPLTVERFLQWFPFPPKVLTWACQEGHLSIVQFLISSGVNLHEDQDAPLRWAVYRRHLPVVQYLLENGANIHTFNDDPLRSATEHYHPSLVRLLLNAGANESIDHDRLLTAASSEGDLDMVQRILQRPRKIQWSDALYWANKHHHTEIVQTILQYLKTH